VQDDGDLAGDGHLCFVGANALHKPGAPGIQGDQRCVRCSTSTSRSTAAPQSGKR
jgi:hypothetical protein